nr:MAG TPA: protein of unknown function DUF859 [Caudoviricetes sp.]
MNNGFFETRDTGLSGYPSRLRFEWWLIEQDVASNRSRIGFKLFGVGGTVTGAWTRMFSAYANVAGQLWETGGHNLYNGTIVIQGEKWVNHDSAGGGWFEVFSDAAIYQNAKNSFGTASWYLPTIPRASQPSITSYPSNTPDFNLGETITIHMNSVNGAFRHNVYFMYADKTYEIARDVQFNCVFDTNKIAEEIYKITTSKKAYSGQIKVDTLFNGNLTGSKTCHYNAHLVGVEPTFTEFTCFDTNATTKAITGNDQVFIQGQSRLGVKIAKEKKAEAKKYASMSKYLASAFGVSATKGFSDTADVQLDLGVVNANTTQVVSVSALDSRDFATVVRKNITVIPYSRPTLNVSAGRKGNFENETIVKISGNITSLIIGSTEKNGVLSLRCRTKSSMDSDFGPTQNIPFTLDSDMILRVPDFYVALDNTLKHMLEFEITDKLSSVKVYAEIDVGIPILRISTKTKKLYNNEERVLTEKDVIPADNIVGQPKTKYSTEEILVGTWIDGRKIYRKVYSGKGDVPHEVQVDPCATVIDMRMMVKNKANNGSWRTVPWLYDTADNSWVAGFYLDSLRSVVVMQLKENMRNAYWWHFVIDYCIDPESMP